MIITEKTTEFDKWIRKLKDLRAKSKILFRIQKLETDEHFGDCKPVGDGISEMRINYAKGYRVYLKENYDSYEEGDTRKDMWWHELEFTDGSTFTFTGGGSMGLPGRSGYYPLKWIAFDEAPNNGGRDTHYQRLAELYLILAEAENELNGPTSVAYEAINTVRRRAFGGLDHDLIGLSKDEFRQAVIDENRWELGGEGLRRWYLWHWGYDTFLQAAEFVSETNPRLLDNVQPHHKWHRIPDEEIINNPNLRQNPGY